MHDDSVRRWKPTAAKGARKQKLSTAHLTVLSETVDVLAAQVALTSVDYQSIFEKVLKKHGH
eukprot:4650155-Amphidinium_carterae.1